MKKSKNIRKWSKARPVKVRLAELQKIFPNTALASNGVPYICPKYVDKDYGCNGHCVQCKEKYWLEEIE